MIKVGGGGVSQIYDISFISHPLELCLKFLSAVKSIYMPLNELHISRCIILSSMISRRCTLCFEGSSTSYMLLLEKVMKRSIHALCLHILL